MSDEAGVRRTEKRMDSLRAALTLIAYSRSTAIPAQFAQELQKMARDALIDDAMRALKGKP